MKVFIFLLVLILDQLTKHWAHSSLSEGVPVEVIPQIFNFTLVYNPGAAFGIFSGMPDSQRRIVLLSVSLIALIVVIKLILTESKDDKYSQYALIGILAGAVGNIIDRFRFDRVVDFLDFYWNNYHWPAFNIADSAISIGVAVLLVRMTFQKQQVKAE